MSIESNWKLQFYSKQKQKQKQNSYYSKNSSKGLRDGLNFIHKKLSIGRQKKVIHRSRKIFGMAAMPFPCNGVVVRSWIF